MLHHYLQRGHSLSELLSLGPVEKRFLKISMVLYYEEEAKRWGAG